MKLYHFAEDEFVLDKNRKYTLREPRLPMKPTGLWLSDETDYGWSKWCAENNFGCLKHVYKCTIKTDKILHLKNVPELKSFTKQYPLAEIPGLESLLSEQYIDWAKVMDEYDGILISPYQWTVRLSIMWYYCWDVASMCVWNLDAIENFQKG